MEKNRSKVIFGDGAGIIFILGMAAVMYMTAFHDKRDENRELKQRIEVLEKRLKLTTSEK